MPLLIFSVKSKPNSFALGIYVIFFYSVCVEHYDFHVLWSQPLLSVCGPLPLQTHPKEPPTAAALRQPFLPSLSQRAHCCSEPPQHPGKHYGGKTAACQWSFLYRSSSEAASAGCPDQTGPPCGARFCAQTRGGLCV